MPNPLRAEVTWEWDDEEYTLKLSNNDLLSLEASLTASAGELLERFTENRYSLRDSMQILQRALITGAKLGRKEALRICEQVSLMDLVPVVLEVLMASYGITDRKDEDGDEDGDDEEPARGKTRPVRAVRPKLTDGVS